MLPNDVARCRGALVESKPWFIPEPVVLLHDQCMTCKRYKDVLPDEVYPYIDSPLGLLADKDLLCDWRISE